LGDILKRAPPQIVAEREHVRLRYQREHLALGIISFARIFECPANAALATLTGIHSGLRGYFIGRVLFQESADAAIQILGVLAHDDEIDIFRLLPGQRRFDAGEQLHGAQIDVLIQFKSQGQEQAFFDDARRHVGVPHGAEKYGVKFSQFVGAPVGQSFAGAQIALAAPIEVRRFVFEIL
jgi:hypothetical protein